METIEALYPSLDHRQSAEVVRKEIIKANLELRGVNYHQLAKYIRITSGPSDWSKWNVNKLLPKSRKEGRVEPRIIGQVAKKENDMTGYIRSRSLHSHR